MAGKYGIGIEPIDRKNVNEIGFDLALRRYETSEWEPGDYVYCGASFKYIELTKNRDSLKIPTGRKYSVNEHTHVTITQHGIQYLSPEVDETIYIYPRYPEGLLLSKHRITGTEVSHKQVARIAEKSRGKRSRSTGSGRTTWT